MCDVGVRFFFRFNGCNSDLVLLVKIEKKEDVTKIQKQQNETNNNNVYEIRRIWQTS